jgi:hypothetical protein
MIRTSIAAVALVIAATPGFAEDCERAQTNATPVTPYVSSYQSPGDFRTGDSYRTDSYRTDGYRTDGYRTGYRYRYRPRHHYGYGYGSY